MLARAIISRFPISKTCCIQVVQQTARVSPFTCKTTSLVRRITCSTCRFQKEEEGSKEKRKIQPDEGCNGYTPRQVDAETSIAYMNSEAYASVYKDQPVWKEYRKNTKGNFYPPVRKTCIRNRTITTGSPCPICRDDYLILDYRNIKLLKQLISEVTGYPLDIKVLGLCRKQYRQLQLEVAKAHDLGYLQKSFTPRSYRYKYYYDLVRNSEHFSETLFVETVGTASEKAADKAEEKQQSSV